MLTFFRKYQKIVFVFTTAVIVISFTFFGAMNSMGSVEQTKEKPLVQAIDGSMISEQKVERMVQFLSSSQRDLKDDKAHSVNLLNDGVLESLFLETDLGHLLSEKIISQIEPDIEKTIQKAGSFHPYRYEGSPFISSESIWAQFAPESAKIATDLTLHSSKLSPLKRFDLLAQGYLQHQMVPSQFVKKVISFQAQQAGQSEDHSLTYADVSLLGLHSAKDWLGPNYLKATAQVIINGAVYAKRKGFRVSTQEAREQLVSNVQQAAKFLSRELGPDTDFFQIYLNQVRNLGMNEPECIDLWKDIALFRKLFDAQSSNLNIDLNSLAELKSIPKQQALVEKFTLPTSLQFKDFTSLMKLQVYADAVSATKRSKEDLLLPKQFLPLSEIEKKAPLLVQRDYVLEYAELDVKKASLQIPLKEMWNWQTTEGWDFLKNRSPALAKRNAQTKEERFAALEEIDAKERAELDKSSREQILCMDQSRIQKELLALPVDSKTVSLSSKGLELPFKGVSNPQSLMSLLEVAPLKGEKEFSPQSQLALQKTSFYTDDQQHYYTIRVVERSPVKKVLTFEQANASGALRQMLDKKLENAYVEVRKRDSLSYMQKDGSWKPFSEVKEKVGFAVFAPYLKAVVAQYKSLNGEVGKEEIESADFYAKNWMIGLMRDSLEKEKLGGQSKTDDPLALQWELVKQKETLAKKQDSILSSVSFAEGAWSSILSLGGKTCFFKVLQSLEEAAPSADEVSKATAPLKKAAQKKLFEDLFSQIEAGKSLSLKVDL